MRCQHRTPAVLFAGQLGVGCPAKGKADWHEMLAVGHLQSCLLVEIRKELIVIEGLFPIDENVKMAKIVQTPGQQARHLQARVRVDNKAKLISSPLAKEPGVRTAPSSPYSSEDHL